MSEWIVIYDDDGNEIAKRKLVRCKDCVYGFRSAIIKGSYHCIIKGANKDDNYYCSMAQGCSEVNDED